MSNQQEDRVNQKIDALIVNARAKLTGEQLDNTYKGIRHALFDQKYAQDPCRYLPTVTPEVALALIEMVREVRFLAADPKLWEYADLRQAVNL